MTNLATVSNYDNSRTILQIPDQSSMEYELNNTKFGSLCATLKKLTLNTPKTMAKTLTNN